MGAAPLQGGWQLAGCNPAAIARHRSVRGWVRCLPASGARPGHPERKAQRRGEAARPGYHFKLDCLHAALLCSLQEQQNLATAVA